MSLRARSIAARLRWLVFFGGLLPACAASRHAATPAASEPAVPPPPASGQDRDRALGPLLWEAVSPTGGTLHLFGTMHTESTNFIPPVARERFAAARIAAFETDLSKLDAQAVLGKAMLPPDQSLDRLLGPEAWHRLCEYLKGGPVPPPMLARFQPWFAVTLVIQKVSGMQPGAEVMDQAMAKQAQEAGKELRFLESPLEQIDTLAQTMTAPAVVALTGSLGILPTLFQKMTEAYRAGDVVALEAILSDRDGRMGMDDEQMRLLLGARNERWVPFLEHMAADGGGFVAVGAGHLPGPDGLVALLRGRGYRVSRVTP